jgi:hypothetical protein
MKRLLLLFLTILLVCAMVPTAFAASSDATQAADALYALGLFNGTGTDANGSPIYDLDRTPTRQEAIAMLVRLLGKEADAAGGTWEIPFTDVADWAKPYVGYAYANGLTSGTSATTFGGSAAVSATQYITFILRALGYESGTDFQWNESWKLSDQLGITSGQYGTATTFTRGDVAIISYAALSASLKDSSTTLSDTLKNTAVLSTANNASNQVKILIISANTDALVSLKSAAQAGYDAASVLEYESFAVYYVQKMQTSVKDACVQFTEAIARCGNYDDTQEMKSALTNTQKFFASLSTNTITSKNYLNYLLDYVSVLEQAQPYMDTATEIATLWGDNA